ncbi:hypothetical protein SLEP1_g16420 [Rubroshorea leprosula]|uniref:Uncharacterized protein n=1 Tax=Rubroshorea leprosula TaxID=152421 RepID=A0AAV5IYE9_9ROSI|nr:hypothetical protein SLEP1_g16420 [Rubroshorea leprosula]
MEALWNLEDKWKLTTQEAVGLFACTALVVIGLCTATILKKKKKKKNDRRKQMLELDHESVAGSIQIDWNEQNCHWVPVKKVLMGSVRWCGANKWGEGERPPPLLSFRRYEPGVGWQSHNSDSPVWQRPILMGEKCELPSFSGLILYDERGQVLDHSVDESSHNEITLQFFAGKINCCCENNAQGSAVIISDEFSRPKGKSEFAFLE